MSAGWGGSKEEFDVHVLSPPHMEAWYAAKSDTVPFFGQNPKAKPIVLGSEGDYLLLDNWGIYYHHKTDVRPEGEAPDPTEYGLPSSFSRNSRDVLVTLDQPGPTPAKVAKVVASAVTVVPEVPRPPITPFLFELAGTPQPKSPGGKADPKTTPVTGSRKQSATAAACSPGTAQEEAGDVDEFTFDPVVMGPPACPMGTPDLSLRLGSATVNKSLDKLVSQLSDETGEKKAEQPAKQKHRSEILNIFKDIKNSSFSSAQEQAKMSKAAVKNKNKDHWTRVLAESTASANTHRSALVDHAGTANHWAKYTLMELCRHHTAVEQNSDQALEYQRQMVEQERQKVELLKKKWISLLCYIVYMS